MMRNWQMCSASYATAGAIMGRRSAATRSATFANPFLATRSVLKALSYLRKRAPNGARFLSNGRTSSVSLPLHRRLHFPAMEPEEEYRVADGDGQADEPPHQAHTKAVGAGAGVQGGQVEGRIQSRLQHHGIHTGGAGGQDAEDEG